MITNRQHFSWSQYDTWNKSKRTYWKRYCLGEKDKGNKYFSKGKEFAKMVEYGENKYEDLLLTEVASQVEHYDVAELELTVQIGDAAPWNKPLKCILDSATEDCKFFIEYKTGKHPWDEDRVYAHDQLLFYATAIYHKYRYIPSAKLYWIETEEIENENGTTRIEYTGRTKMFSRLFSTEEISRFTVKILKMQKEIYEYEYKEDILNFDVSKRYAELAEQKAEIEKEMNEIKYKIQDEMLEEDIDSAQNAILSATVVTRKKWRYSETVADIEKTLKKQKKFEETSGKAKFDLNKYIMLKLK